MWKIWFIKSLTHSSDRKCYFNTQQERERLNYLYIRHTKVTKAIFITVIITVYIIPHYLNVFLILSFLCYPGKTRLLGHSVHMWTFYLAVSPISFVRSALFFTVAKVFSVLSHVLDTHVTWHIWMLIHLCDKRTDRYVWEVRHRRRERKMDLISRLLSIFTRLRRHPVKRLKQLLLSKRHIKRLIICQESFGN